MSTPNFIQESDFVGQIELVYCDGFPLDFAAQVEAQEMEKLLGYHLYALAKAAPTTKKYDDLLNGTTWTDADGVVKKHEGIIKIVAYLFYYQYVRDLIAKITSGGLVIPINDEGEPTKQGLTLKAVRAYAIAAEYYQKTIEFIYFKNDETADYYEEFQPFEMVLNTNTWGI